MSLFCLFFCVSIFSIKLTNFLLCYCRYLQGDMTMRKTFLLVQYCCYDCVQDWQCYWYLTQVSLWIRWCIHCLISKNKLRWHAHAQTLASIRIIHRKHCFLGSNPKDSDSAGWTSGICISSKFLGSANAAACQPHSQWTSLTKITRFPVGWGKYKSMWQHFDTC